MKKIAIVNQKGGVGKTATAVNLGRALAASGKKVLLIDSDPQGDTTKSTGIKSVMKNHLFDFIESKIGDKEVNVPLESCIYPYAHDPNLHILPCDSSLHDLENRQVISRETVYPRFLSEIEGMDYDYVFIDSPPSLGLFVVNALGFSHEVIAPIQAEYLAVTGTAQLFKTVNLVRKQLNPKLKFNGVVITMYKGNTNQSRNVKEHIHSSIPKEIVYETLIRQNVKLGEAPTYGVSIFEYDPGSNGAKDYSSLCEEFLAREAKNG